MKKIKILLTFDYELPLGASTDYQRGLFRPAELLLQAARESNVPLAFYADICSAVRFKEWDYNGYYQSFAGQLQQAIRGGHEVALHIHPHWMTSGYSSGQFVPSGDYSLSNFAREKSGYTIENIISVSCRELIAICREADPAYRCLAFRAGGYDVEPESARIIAALHKLGILYESSVIKEFYLDYNFSRIDYRNSPSPSRWRVSPTGNLMHNADSGLIELPITSRPVTPIDIVARRWLKTVSSAKYRSRIYSNGGKGFLAAHGSQSLRGTFRKITNPVVLSLDKEYLDYSHLKSIVDYNVKKYNHEANDLILTAIGHPKSMGVYHLDLMRRFVEGMRRKYGEGVSFVTYQDLNLV